MENSSNKRRKKSSKCSPPNVQTIAIETLVRQKHEAKSRNQHVRTDAHELVSPNYWSEPARIASTTKVLKRCSENEKMSWNIISREINQPAKISSISSVCKPSLELSEQFTCWHFASVCQLSTMAIFCEGKQSDNSPGVFAVEANLKGTTKCHWRLRKKAGCFCLYLRTDMRQTLTHPSIGANNQSEGLVEPTVVTLAVQHRASEHIQAWRISLRNKMTLMLNFVFRTFRHNASEHHTQLDVAIQPCNNRILWNFTGERHSQTNTSTSVSKPSVQLARSAFSWSYSHAKHSNQRLMREIVSTLCSQKWRKYSTLSGINKEKKRKVGNPSSGICSILIEQSASSDKVKEIWHKTHMYWTHWQMNTEQEWDWNIRNGREMKWSTSYKWTAKTQLVSSYLQFPERHSFRMETIFSWNWDLLTTRITLAANKCVHSTHKARNFVLFPLTSSKFCSSSSRTSINAAYNVNRESLVGARRTQHMCK